MQNEKSARIVANWLFLGVAMLIIQVLLGGITRLTGSGLSITEWDPVMGAFPPVNDQQWQEAFFQYQHIAQYKYLNNHFTLADFKFIFFWEWFHRLWARLIGMVFLVPFIYFIIKKYFKRWMIIPLILLFVLGALQGLIGWIMVKSGLNDEDIYVSHFKLAVHFMAAMILIGYTLIFGLAVAVPKEHRVYNHGLRKQAWIIFILVVLQLIYGAFLAGLKAANAAPTWPDMNTQIIPGGMFANGFIQGVLRNPITIQFIHRTLAYIIFILIVIWSFKAKKETFSSPFSKIRKWPLILVLLQLLLGIMAVLSSTKIVLGKFGIFEWFAILHQFTGMLLLFSLLVILHILKPYTK